MRSWLNAWLLATVLILVPTSASSDPVSDTYDAIVGRAKAAVANGVRDAALRERGDVWIVTLVAQQPQCSTSRADGEYRARRLARRYEAFSESAHHEDGAAILSASRELYGQIHASRMYRHCWTAMQNRASELATASGAAVDIIALAVAAGL